MTKDQLVVKVQQLEANLESKQEAFIEVATLSKKLAKRVEFLEMYLPQHAKAKYRYLKKKLDKEIT